MWWSGGVAVGHGGAAEVARQGSEEQRRAVVKPAGPDVELQLLVRRICCQTACPQDQITPDDLARREAMSHNLTRAEVASDNLQGVEVSWRWQEWSGWG